MRKVLGWLLVLVLPLAAGCNSVRSLRSEVDTANRSGLERPQFRSAMLMRWDNAPKEWLMLTEVHRTPEPAMMHSMLTFYEGQLALSTRAEILNGGELSASPPSATPDSVKKRLDDYAKAGREVRAGKFWTGAAPVTMVNPGAVPYRTVGTLPFDGRTVRMLAGDITSNPEVDPFAIYDRAWVLVGLDDATGDLAFEYIVNRVPRKDAANRILSVIARPDSGVDLTATQPAASRLESYMTLYTALHKLEEQLYQLMPPDPVSE